MFILGGADRQTVRVALDEVRVLARPAVLLYTDNQRRTYTSYTHA